jgi:hypothetical protein
MRQLQNNVDRGMALPILRDIRFYLVAHNNPEAAEFVKPFQAAALVKSGNAVTASMLCPSDLEWARVEQILAAN